MVDHCQHGPAPQNSSVGSLNLLSCLPRSQSTTRKTISVLGSNQGPVHKHTSAVSGRCMYSTPEQRKAPAIYGTSYCRYLASNGHLFGEKNHQRSKGFTPAIGISAVPARHKSESPWGNTGGLCQLHLLVTLTWIMIPWAKWTLTLWQLTAATEVATHFVDPKSKPWQKTLPSIGGSFAALKLDIITWKWLHIHSFSYLYFGAFWQIYRQSWGWSKFWSDFF